MELIKLLKDKSDDVKAEAYKGLAVAANWRFVEAQEILEQGAKKKTAPAEERVPGDPGARQGGQARPARQLRGPNVVWTLVLLLDDDELKVREAAFATLKDGVKDVFGYTPDAAPAQRKTAVASWKTCATRKAGRRTAVPPGRARSAISAS
jgi:hypothetical protein